MTHPATRRMSSRVTRTVRGAVGAPVAMIFSLGVLAFFGNPGAGRAWRRRRR